MAVSVQSVPALVWQSTDGGSANLFCPVVCDFRVFPTYMITAQGAFAQTGNLSAEGAIFDNLDNANFIEVLVKQAPDRVAPFSKSPLQLFGNAVSLALTAKGGVLRAVFFRGRYPGAPYGLNVRAAVG